MIGGTNRHIRQARRPGSSPAAGGRVSIGEPLVSPRPNSKQPYNKTAGPRPAVCPGVHPASGGGTDALFGLARRSLQPNPGRRKTSRRTNLKRKKPESRQVASVRLVGESYLINGYGARFLAAGLQYLAADLGDRRGDRPSPDFATRAWPLILATAAAVDRRQLWRPRQPPFTASGTRSQFR